VAQLVQEWWASWRPVPAKPVAYGTEVVYQGHLADHHGEVFIVQPHNHMYDITDLDDDCWCDTGTRFTLVSQSGMRCLVHVDRSHFTPAA
jgi:hypothetical protein